MRCTRLSTRNVACQIECTSLAINSLPGSSCGSLRRAAQRSAEDTFTVWIIKKVFQAHHFLIMGLRSWSDGSVAPSCMNKHPRMLSAPCRIRSSSTTRRICRHRHRHRRSAGFDARRRDEHGPPLLEISNISTSKPGQALFCNTGDRQATVGQGFTIFASSTRVFRDLAGAIRCKYSTASSSLPTSKSDHEAG